MSILIRDVLLNGKKTNILIEGNRIESAGPKTGKAEYVIDGKGKAALPGFVNTHTHSAMTLFRSYADDLKLHVWLEKHIWPREALLTEEDVYWGAKLACLEMIKSGTTTFNDNYWHMMGTVRAADEMGMRAVACKVFIDLDDPERAEKEKKENVSLVKKVREMGNSRIQPGLAPHAPYTVSIESLKWIKEYSEKEKLLINFHLAETEKENADFYMKHKMRPVPFLEDIGFLGGNLVAAHGIWFDEKDLSILARHKVKIAHNPVSNMKLASGVMPYAEMTEAGITVSLGTDGCASNNDLDMFESMKFASLLQKVHRHDATVLSAREALDMASINGANALGINAGAIEAGMLADVVLVDLKRPELTPLNNLTANLVYSAKGSCVDTVICDGKLIMENRKVKGEEEIMEKAADVAKDLFAR
ncbi:MAG: amidohydrolase [Candidatus Altiarchaeia archaeon]